MYLIKFSRIALNFLHVNFINLFAVQKEDFD